jgi:integrase
MSDDIDIIISRLGNFTRPPFTAVRFFSEIRRISVEEVCRIGDGKLGTVVAVALVKKAHCQNLRYSFAARLFEKNTDVRTIQTLLGHKNLKTTLSYTNYFGRSDKTVQSPLDY